MTDRELLELAAKAAGYKKYYTHYLGRDSFVTYDEIYYSEAKEREVTGEKTMDWNPLANDGDALRLAVKLGLFMRQAVKEIPRAEYEKDPYAATRRAIVRAAAAIGTSL